jgi:hypothetical protein
MAAAIEPLLDLLVCLFLFGKRNRKTHRALFDCDPADDAGDDGRRAIVRRNHLRFNLWFGKTSGALNVALQCARHRDRPLIRYISDSNIRRSLFFPLIFKIIHGTIL